MSDVEFLPVGCAVLTVSDTRTVENDTSGALACERLTTMGHRVVSHAIVRDEIPDIRAGVGAHVADDEVSIVILTGGTGLTLRDVTPEACAPLADKRIPGFGELFRQLSYEEIGTSTIQSRADAWVCAGTLVFALPGSPGAVRTAMDRILVQQLDIRQRPCNFIEMLPRIQRGRRGR